MFQRELKVNYGSIDRLVGDIETYQNALSVMKQKVKQIWELLEESSGESYESLKERKETILNQISSCEEELGDLHELLAGYSYDMQSAIAPVDRDRMMVVDRNDIWCNMESILNACDRISSMVYNVNVPWFGTIYTAFAEDDVKAKERKYYNRLENVREKIQRSYQENIADRKVELVRLYENKVVVYENTDDEYASRVSSDYYPKYTSLGESFLNVFEWLGEAMTDFTEGVMEGLIGLIDGVGELLWGIGEFAVSGITVFVCERINCEAPKWATTNVSKVEETIGAIMDEPLILLEGISQEISDMGEGEGIWYCAGYAAGMYAGGKGLSEAEKAARVKLKGEFDKNQTPKIEIDDALDELAQGERVVVEGGKNVWDMTEGGGIINGREYSQHAMERMAPDTPSVRAELSRRAEGLAESKGLQVGIPEYYQFCQKYVDPRNIPPSVIEDVIRNTTAVPGHTAGTFVHQTVDVTVIVNETGKVITVIPK